jgi:hypothetical protein
MITTAMDGGSVVIAGANNAPFILNIKKPAVAGFSISVLG